MSELYTFSNVSKIFSTPNEKVEIFKNINLKIEEKESLAIVGSSGSGKSTLLHLMGALDIPTKGTVHFDNRNLAEFTPNQKAEFRNKTLGFVFQFHHLLPEFSALENVAMPAIIGGKSLQDVEQNAIEMLERVGLKQHIKSKVATLSGGERQRVAIARAILLHPRVLLADEPTGNLDETNGQQVGLLLEELNKELGMTLVVVTHNIELASQMGRCLELRAGTLYEKSFD